MLKVLWLVGRALAIPIALAACYWLIFTPPKTGAGKAGLVFVFFIAVAVVAHWISEAHQLAATPPKRMVGALSASAVASGLLAAVLAIPNAPPSDEAGARSSVEQTAKTTPTATAPSPSATPRPSAGLTVGPGVTSSPFIGPTGTSTDDASNFFIQNYFPTALQDPEAALTRYGTEAFRLQKKRTGVQSYISFYLQTRSIPSDQVRVSRHGNARDAFEVRFLRVLKSGETSDVATLYVVQCESSSTLDRYGCASGDLRVDSSEALH